MPNQYRLRSTMPNVVIMSNLTVTSTAAHQQGGALAAQQLPRTSPDAEDPAVAAVRKRAIRARCQAQRPAKMGSRDVRYVKASYLSLAALIAQSDRALVKADVETMIDEGQLPQPSYVLPDGTGMFPADYFALWDAAGAGLPAWFRARYEAVAADRRVTLAADEADQAWIDYLTGMYGVCLKQACPETILDKGIRTDQIESLVADPLPGDDGWLNALGSSVDALDSLLRPFTGLDRRRFGVPTSRDRLITAVRRSYPHITASAMPNDPPKP
jgi:hypothetical protein